MKSFLSVLFVATGVGILATTGAGAEQKGTDMVSSAAVVRASSPNAAGSDFNFDALEVSGISRIGAEAMVCVCDPALRRSVWLSVGRQSPGVWIERLDSERDLVSLRFGERSRSVALRKSTVTPIPVARMADGSVDFVHMSMSEEQKAQEAQMLMWDILEVGRLARSGQLPAHPEKKQ